MAWVPDGKVIATSSFDSTVQLWNAETGKVQRIFQDRDSAWTDVVDRLQWTGNGRLLVWTSERDGWNHAYTIARDGAAHLVTAEPADVVSVSSVDLAGEWLYYIASPANATERYLYRSRLDGIAKSERVTPAGAPGAHSYEISPDCRHNSASPGSGLCLEGQPSEPGQGQGAP